ADQQVGPVTSKPIHASHSTGARSGMAALPKETAWPSARASSEVTRDGRASGLVALLARGDPGVASGAAPILRVQRPAEVVEALVVVGVLLHRQLVDRFGSLVALGRPVPGTQVHARLDAVRAELHGALEAPHRRAVVVQLIGGEAVPQLHLRVAGAALRQLRQVLAGGDVLTVAVERASGDEAGVEHQFRLAQARDRLLRVGERLVTLRQ